MNQYEKFKVTVEKYDLIPTGKNVLACVSAGKNSSAMLHLLNKYRQEKEFPLNIILFRYPPHVYEELDKKVLYWKEKGVNITVLTPTTSDEELDKTEDACHLCKDVRRELFQSYLKDNKINLADIVLATGHGVWDLNAYLAEMNTWSKENLVSSNKRFIELTHRFFPKIKMDNGVTFIRPCIALNDTEVISLLEQEHIPHQEVSCRFEEERPKRLVFKHFLEENILFSYDETFAALKKFCNLPTLDDFETLSFEEYLL